MPYSAGVFSRPVSAYANGSVIVSADMNSEMDGMATGLTTALTKDGQTTPTANLPMGGFGHTGVALATARTMYARASQIADGSLTYGGVAGGTADALTIAPSPVITAYVIGQQFQFKVGAAANTTAGTLNVNGVGAGAVTWPDGTALVAGDLPANAMVLVEVQATTPVFHLMTQTRAPGTSGGTLTGAGGTITSTDASAAAGPTFTLDRNSASPAASDVIGEIPFKGRDSGAGTNTYARAYGVIIDPTAASEDGEYRFDTVVAGTEANRLRLGAGLYTAGATGGDKGVDTVNAAAIYENGGRIGRPLLATLTASASTALNFTATNSTLYAAYEVVFENILAATDAANFIWQVSIDAGSSYITTGTYVDARQVAASTPASSAGGGVADTAVPMIPNVSNVSVAHAVAGDALVTVGGAVAGATKIKFVVGAVISGAAAASTSSGYGYNTTASQVNAFRFAFSSGNITSGTIRVYGIPK